MIINFTNIIQGVIAIGAIVFATAQWRNGRSKKNSDAIQVASNTIELLQKSVEALNGELQKQRVDLSKEHDEIIRLQEALKHKDAQIEQYLQILQNRNPEMDIFMTFVTKTSSDAVKYMETTTKLLMEIDRKLSIVVK